MKKIIAIIVVALFVAGISMTGFAADTKTTVSTSTVIKGEIMSIDMAKNEIAVKNKAGEIKTVVADPQVLSTLKVGDMVKVTIKAGENKASEVIKVVKKEKIVKQ